MAAPAADAQATAGGAGSCRSKPAPAWLTESRHAYQQDLAAITLECPDPQTGARHTVDEYKKQGEFALYSAKLALVSGLAIAGRRPATYGDTRLVMAVVYEAATLETHAACMPRCSPA
jgi:hypothetical protein